MKSTPVLCRELNERLAVVLKTPEMKKELRRLDSFPDAQFSWTGRDQSIVLEFTHDRLCERGFSVAGIAGLKGERLDIFIKNAVTSIIVEVLEPSCLSVKAPPKHSFSPEPSEYKCHLCGNALVWTPEKGQEPNWFWRWMQYLFFGFRWNKIK